MKPLSFKSNRFNIKTITQNECKTKYLNWIENEKYIEFNNNKKITVSDLRKYINKKKNKYFFAIFTKSKKHIGNIKFERIKKNPKVFEMGILVGDNRWKYKGVFKEVFLTVVPHIYYLEKISMIYLGVSKKNISAIKTFKKTGFKITKSKKNSFIMKYNLSDKLHDISRLIVGTAQFMNKYGFFKNELRKTKNINDLLELCKDYRILKLDTALAYNNFRIIERSKDFKKFKINLKITNLKEYFYIKKKYKRVNNINLMLHNDSLIKENKTNLKFINSNNLGLSVYWPAQLKNLKNISTIQFPLNIFNQKFISNSVLKLVNNKKYELQARSIFLQGLLINRKLPTKFLKFKNTHLKWFAWLDKNRLHSINVCLNFILNLKNINQLILGVNSSDQLKEIIQNLWIKKIRLKKTFSKVDTRLSNIDKWKEL